MANYPMTRKEFYLAKMAGEDVTVPEPMTREETYLKKIAENGGSGNNMLIVEMNIATNTLDKTWTEIKNAVFPVVVIKSDEDTKQWMSIVSAEHNGGSYTVDVIIDGSTVIFATDTADGYPSATWGG